MGGPGSSHPTAPSLSTARTSGRSIRSTLRSPATCPDQRALPDAQPRQFRLYSPGGFHRGLAIAQQSMPPAHRNPGVGVLQLASDTQSKPFREISFGQVGREFGATSDLNAADQR